MAGWEWESEACVSPVLFLQVTDRGPKAAAGNRQISGSFTDPQYLEGLGESPGAAECAWRLQQGDCRSSQCLFFVELHGLNQDICSSRGACSAWFAWTK